MRIGWQLLAVLLAAVGCTTATGQAHAESPRAASSTHAADDPCDTCVGVIGDSLTFQGGTGPDAIRLAIKTAYPSLTDVRVDGLKGRGIAGDKAGTSSLQVIQDWRDNGFDPGVFVIALGTNNPGLTPDNLGREVRKVLTKIGPGHEVHWIGLGFTVKNDDHAVRFKETVAPMMVGEWFFHDWDDYVHTFPQDGLWDDKGVHMTPKGYGIRNPYYAAVLKH